MSFAMRRCRSPSVATRVANRDDVATAKALDAEFFPEDPPARSTPIVDLPRGLLFSVEAIDVVP
jgi:2-iminobutanoate/2-iminopropanoate deaminase